MDDLFSIEDQWNTLSGDAGFTAALRELRASFGAPRAPPRMSSVYIGYWGGYPDYEVENQADRPDSLLRCAFALYCAPAGPGRTAKAGKGTTRSSNGRTAAAGMGARRGRFQIIGVMDGLPNTRVNDLLQDRAGNMWFATKGACRYDGHAITCFTREDGLAYDWVTSVLEDRAGNLWFGTTTGLTRFRPPPPSHPRITIDAVVADRRHEGTAVLAIPSTVSLVAFEFHGTSFKTRSDAIVYRYRLEGHAPEWRTTRARRVEYEDLPTGTYTFAMEGLSAAGLLERIMGEVKEFRGETPQGDDQAVVVLKVEK